MFAGFLFCIYSASILMPDSVNQDGVISSQSSWPTPIILQTDTLNQRNISKALITANPRSDSKTSMVSASIYALAITTSGVLLAGSGVAYWTHRTMANSVAERNGVDPLKLAVVATIAIPVGCALSVFGGQIFLSNFGYMRDSVDE